MPSDSGTAIAKVSRSGSVQTASKIPGSTKTFLTQWSTRAIWMCANNFGHHGRAWTWAMSCPAVVIGCLRFTLQDHHQRIAQV